jgi:hypothetical protein
MIDIQLSQTEVRVGDVLSGRLIWTPARPLPKQATVAIGWRTEGRGTVNSQKVQELQIDCDRFATGITTTIPVQFQIPTSAPVSYDGLLLRIIWEATVVLAFPGLLTRNQQQAMLFRVLPRSS